MEKKRKKKNEEEEKEDKKEQGEGEKTQVRRFSILRNLLVGGDNNLFAKLLQAVQRRWSLAVKVLNSKEIEQAGGLEASIKKVSMPEAHTPLLVDNKYINTILHSSSHRVQRKHGKTKRQ